MIARLVIGLIFISTVLIARPAIAQSPYFDEYIDHAKFVQLSPQDQRDFLIALMQTVADMEQKSVQAGHHTGPTDEKKTVHQQRWDAVKKALKRFQDQLAISSAVAQAVPAYADTCFAASQASARSIMENGQPATCLFGSYRSSYVSSTDRLGRVHTYCQRPGCSINPEIRAAYSRVAQQGLCSKTQMACNPALFGYDNSGVSGQKPTCIQLDISVGTNAENRKIVNTVQNASLACLIAVANDRTKEKRLDDIAKSIKDNPATAQEFNKLLHTVTNLCICDGSVGNNAEVPEYLRDMSNTYSKYVKDHRTCNALLSQTSEVLKRVSAGGGCVADILPNNVTALSRDLNYINTYSSRFLLLARTNAGIANGGALTSGQIHSAMARYSNRWVVDDSFSKTTEETKRSIPQSDIKRVSAEGALDNIASYMQEGAALKARDSRNENRWCPLRFPTPVTARPTEIECQFTAQPGTRATNGKVSFAATVAVTGVPTDVTSTIAWTVNGSPVAGQTTGTLTVSDLDGIAPTVGTVAVVATYTFSNRTTKAGSGVANVPVAPVNNVPCEIKETVVYDGANAKITFTVEKNAAMIPAATAMTVMNGETTVPAAASGSSYEIIVPRSQTPVVLSASAASATAGAPALRCEKSVTLTPAVNAPQQTACSLTIGEPTADPADANKLKATVSIPSSVTGITAIVWTPALPAHTTERAAGATVATSATLTFDKPAAGAAQKIVASAVVTTTTGTATVNCTGEKTITPPVVAVVATPEGCDLSVGVVAGEEGKYSVSATITSATGPKAPKADTQPSYAGLSFSVANNIGMAVVDAGRELQTKEITATYTGTDNKSYSCKAIAAIPAKAPAAGGGGGFAPPPGAPMMVPGVRQDVFLKGLN